MGSIARMTRYIKDFWRVIVRGESEDLQHKTLSMQEELTRLRNRRLTSDKEHEVAALNQARGAVHRMRELHDSLLAAEKATSEFAAKLGEAARSSIEAHAGTREQAYKRFFAKQKELYQQEVKRDLQGETGLPLSELPIQFNVQDEATKAPSNGHDEASKAPELKLSDPVDGGKDTGFAAKGASMASEAGEVQTCPAVVQDTVEEATQPIVSGVPDETTPSSSSDQNPAGNKMDFTPQEIPEDVIVQMMQEAKRQVRCEEKSHLDALARDKAILEKEIEAREREHGSMSQGHQ